MGIKRKGVGNTKNSTSKRTRDTCSNTSARDQGTRTHFKKIGVSCACIGTNCTQTITILGFSGSEICSKNHSQEVGNHPRSIGMFRLRAFGTLYTHTMWIHASTVSLFSYFIHQIILSTDFNRSLRSNSGICIFFPSSVSSLDQVWKNYTIFGKFFLRISKLISKDML